MKILDASKLSNLAEALAGAGFRVVVPVADGDRVRYAEWTPGATIRTDAFPVNSAKDFLFPRSEVVDRYQLDGDDFTPVEVHPQVPQTVLLAVRPCDAAALAMLDTLFNWDYEDELYNARRAATTIVPMVCTQADAQCFCTSVGGAPDATTGADALLRPADGGARFILEPLTDKGKALVEAAGSTLADGEATPDAPADVPVRFDPEKVRAPLGRPQLRLPGLRGLRLCLPNLPLLRHAGRDHAHRKRPPAELGLVRVRPVYKARQRPQPAAEPGGPLAKPCHAQILVHPRAVQPAGVHRLRALRAAVPGGHGHARGLHSHRGRSQEGAGP